MPRLNNPNDFDVYAPQIHQMVPALDGIDITDAEAGLFVNNSTFTVGEPAEAEPADEASEESTDSAPAKRKYTKRGGAVAEVDAAPVMETRG